MTVGFNPMVSNNRQQKTNFKAFTVIKNGKPELLERSDVLKGEHTARNFIHLAIDGKIPKTPENIKELFTAIQEALKERKLDVSTYLEEVRDDIWKIKQ